MSFFEQLVRDLDNSGTASSPGLGDRSLLITTFHDRPVEPAMELAVGRPEFERHLEAMSAESAAMYPDVDPVTAAYRLFLVHIDETIITRAMPGSRITLVDGRLRVDPERPADPLPDLDPDDEYVWTSEPPGGRRLLGT